MTPDKLPTLRGDRRGQKAEQDGFIDRVLLSFPPEPPMTGENWREIAPDTLMGFRNVMAALRALGMIPVMEGARTKGYRPFLVLLTEDGRQAWTQFTRDNADQANAEDFSPVLRGPWSKLLGYCARLALVLHMLRWACGEFKADDGSLGDGTDPVDGESMRRAVLLVDYFKGHARKVYSVLDTDPRIADARHVLRWLASKPDLKAFTRRDVHQGLKRNHRFEHPDSLDAPLNLLEQHGYIRQVVESTTRKPGRPGTDRFERNPLWVPSRCFEDIEDIENILQGEKPQGTGGVEEFPA
jgi:hypothetical protein